MDTLTLEKQSWSLFLRLRYVFENECTGRSIRTTPSVRRERLTHAFERAYSRFIRRQNTHFNYQPDGFVLSPALLSDVLGHGSTIKKPVFVHEPEYSFNDEYNQFINHDFVSHEQQINGDLELTQSIEFEHKNGLEIIPHIPRMGGLRKKAVFVNRDVKESPLSITSGLLSCGKTNS